MKRSIPIWLAVLATAIVMVGPAAQPAAAKPCRNIQSLSGERLVFYKYNMSCRSARRYAHRLMRHGNYDPPRYKCQRSSPTSGGCEHRFKQKGFLFYPEH